MKYRESPIRFFASYVTYGENEYFVSTVLPTDCDYIETMVFGPGLDGGEQFGRSHSEEEAKIAHRDAEHRVRQMCENGELPWSGPSPPTG
jgi:hypothetical protein